MTPTDTFPLTKCINISTAFDDFYEGDETFSVYVSDFDPTGVLSIGSPFEHTVTIIDAGKVCTES